VRHNRSIGDLVVISCERCTVFYATPFLEDFDTVFELRNFGKRLSLPGIVIGVHRNENRSVFLNVITEHCVGWVDASNI